MPLLEEGAYFTIHSLENAVQTKLVDLGFGAPFYAGLPEVSGKFECTKLSGTAIFYKGENRGGISNKTFFRHILSAYESVEIEDYISDCYEKYGVKITDKYDVINATSDTELYYDSIMGKIYRNKSCYYSEFDE